MPHAVIFDIDDTLLHSMAADDRLYRQAIRDIVGEVQFRESLADYEHVSDTGILRQVLIDNGIEATASTLRTVEDTFIRSLEDYVATHGPFQEIAGARDVIRRLQNSPDHVVALATGCWRRSAELKLRTAGFAFGGLPLATADDAMARDAIMQTALNALPADPDSITYFGDGIWDQRACANLSWTFRPVGEGLNGLTAYHDVFSELAPAR